MSLDIDIGNVRISLLKVGGIIVTVVALAIGGYAGVVSIVEAHVENHNKHPHPGALTPESLLGIQADLKHIIKQQDKMQDVLEELRKQ